MIEMKYKAINFKEKYSQFQEQWKPKVISEMNDYQFKLVKSEGEFVWHNHRDTDEAFIVMVGSMAIDFRDGRVDLSSGEMFVVPKGIDHKPFAESECSVLLIEPKGVTNTGDEESDLKAENDVWI